MDYGNMKDLMKVQQDAMKVKKELENTLIEAEVDGLVITFNGEMKVEKVFFEDTKIVWDQKALEYAIQEACNKGLKKSQELASQKMQAVMKNMGVDPSMLWGMGM